MGKTKQGNRTKHMMSPGLVQSKGLGQTDIQDQPEKEANLTQAIIHFPHTCSFSGT